MSDGGVIRSTSLGSVCFLRQSTTLAGSKIVCAYSFRDPTVSGVFTLVGGRPRALPRRRNTMSIGGVRHATIGLVVSRVSHAGGSPIAVVSASGLGRATGHTMGVLRSTMLHNISSVRVRLCSRRAQVRKHVSKEVRSLRPSVPRRRCKGLLFKCLFGRLTISGSSSFCRDGVGGNHVRVRLGAGDNHHSAR